MKAGGKKIAVSVTLLSFFFAMGVYLSPSIRYAKDKLLFLVNAQEVTHPDYYYSARRESLFNVLDGNKPLVIAGDSRVDEVEWHELLGRSDVANRGIGGDTVGGLTKRIIGYLNTNTSVCVIQIGFNDLLQGNDPGSVFLEYVNLLKLLNEREVRVVVMAIIHAGEQYFYLNPSIVALNEKLRQFAITNKHQWLDVNPALCDPSMSLKQAFTIDGIHLSGVAYRTISSEINAILGASDAAAIYFNEIVNVATK